jgi:oligosaccharide repeat unit polymerase
MINKFKFWINFTLFILFSVIFILYNNDEKMMSAFPALVVQFLAGVLILFRRKTIVELLSPSVVFYIYFEVFIGIGSILIYIEPDLLLHTIVTEPKLSVDLYTYMWTMSFAILFLSISVSIAREMRSYQDSLNVVQSEFFKKSTILINKYWLVILIGFLLSLAIGMIKFIFFVDFSEVLSGAIIGEITGRDYRQLLSQSQYTGGDYYGQGYFNFIIYKVLPFFSLLVFIKYDLEDVFVLKWFSFILTCIIIYGELRRTPILQMITMLFFYKAFTKKNLNIKKIAMWFTILITLIVVSTLVLGRYSEANGIKGAYDAIMYRLFISQTQTGSFIFQIYPYLKEFSYGGIYVKNLSGILPGVDLAYSADIFAIIHDRIGGASHSSMAEAYANFGFIGVLFFSVGLGWYFFVIEKKMVKEKANILYFSFYIVFLSFVVSAISNGSIIGSILQIITIYICIKLIKFFSVFFKKIQNA